MSEEAKVRRAVIEEKKWSDRDFDLAPLRLEIPKCRFFSATHKTRPIALAPVYGLLSDGTVVTQSDQSAVEKILAACDSKNISASNWAELLARFHWDVAPGTVLYASEPPLVEGEAPKRIAPPKLENSELRFSLRNPETQRLYEIIATIRDGKLSSVSKKARD